MTPNTAPSAAERSRDLFEPDLSDEERRAIEQAAALKPHDGHRMIEALCSLGPIAKLMVR